MFSDIDCDTVGRVMFSVGGDSIPPRFISNVIFPLVLVTKSTNSCRTFERYMHFTQLDTQAMIQAMIHAMISPGSKQDVLLKKKIELVSQTWLQT